MSKRRADKISAAGEWTGPDFGKGLSLSDAEIAELRAMRERLARAEQAGEFEGNAERKVEAGTETAISSGGLKVRPPEVVHPKKMWLGWPLWMWALAVGIVATVVVQRFDVRINEWMKPVREGLGGDVRREWSALQQFGQGSSIVIVGVLVWCLDAGRRKRLVDYAIAMAVTAVAVTGMKMLVGRPRPRFGEADVFLWPWGTYPVSADVTKNAAGSEPVMQHAWETAAWKHGQLWSMPSSHTALACVMAAFIWVMYPRVKWLGVALAAIVAVGRLVFDAHWGSDVVMGACVGAAVGIGVMGRRGG